METSVKAAEVLVPPQPDVASSENTGAEVEAPPAACSASADLLDPMEEFSRRLEDIIGTYGCTAGLLDRQKSVEVTAEMEKMEAKDDIAVAMETEVSVIMQSLNTLSSAEEKLDSLVRKYAEAAAMRRCDEKKLSVLQQRFSVLLDEQLQLQAENRSSIAARSKLESLCRELQEHYSTLREETFRRCREDEEKRKEMTSHFQTMLTEIQAQIEQHSARNDKLCHENVNLTDKLESLMTQCERREESLEKISERRDLQHRLTEAKLQQANALLLDAEEKHKREKEYLLVQAAEWKLQAQTLREQGTVMQAQLTLYAQKFDEFQETLAKSNEIYVRFKKEMDNMSGRMKKMEKESNLWKTRFENCNKALTDMIEERAEKSKEYEVFVLKIQKLEKLCRVLQDERVVLYGKIKEVRQANCEVPKAAGLPKLSDTSAALTPADLQELQQLQEGDPVLTKDMARLREEQAKLQEFASSLLFAPSDNDEEDKEDLDTEEDLVASALVQFKTRGEVRKEAESVPEQVDVKPEAAEPVLPQSHTGEEVPVPVDDPSQIVPTDTKPEAVEVQTQAEDKEVQPLEIQQQPAEPAPASEPEAVQVNPPADPEPEAAEADAHQAKPEDKKVHEPVQVPGDAPAKSEAAPPSKQTPKKKKKRNSRNAS